MFVFTFRSVLCGQTHQSSRIRLRAAGVFDHGGVFAVWAFVAMPILIDIFWVGLYFAERQADTFYDTGPCDVNSDNPDAAPSPFFLSYRSEAYWNTQCVFTFLFTFYLLPMKSLSIDPRASFVTTLGLAFVECVTLSPFLISMCFLPAKNAYVPTFLRVWTAHNSLAGVFADSTVRDKSVRLVVAMVAVGITMIAVFEYSQNNWAIVPPLGQPNLSGKEYVCASFLDSLYWFVVTFATVGYGDIVPSNNVARVVVIICIVVFLVLLPLFVNSVFEIVELLSDYALMSHHIDGAFVIVDGHFRGRLAHQAMRLIQPLDQLDKYSHLVLLIKTPQMSVSLKEARRASDTVCRLVLLSGTVASTKDAERARASRASALFVLPSLADETASQSHTPSLASAEDALSEMRVDVDSIREACLDRDWDVVGRTWAVRSLAQIPLRVMLFHHVSLDLVAPPLVQPGECSCLLLYVLTLDRLEQLVGACSTLMPGFSSLFVNLLIAGGLNSSPNPGIVFRYEDESQMVLQYARDLIENNLFVLSLPAAGTLGQIAMRGLRTNTAVLAGFKASSLCSARQMCDPESFIFDHSLALSKNDMVVCMSRDREALLKSLHAERELQPVSIERVVESDPPRWAASPDEAASAAATRPKIPLGRAPSSQRFFSHSKRGHETLEEMLEDEQSKTHFLTTSEPKRTERRRDDVRAQGRPLTALDALFPPHAVTELHGHIIVSADDVAHPSLLAFVRHLRRAELTEPIRSILILRPQQPSSTEWSEVAKFPDVYWQLGRPYILHDLKRAGFEQAHALVVLCDARTQYAGSGHDSVVMDKDKLLTIRAATMLRKEQSLNVHVFVHFACEANLALCGSGLFHMAKHVAGWNSLSSMFDISNGFGVKAALTLDGNRLYHELQKTWPPIWQAAVCEGSVWSPSSLMLQLWVFENKGPWMPAFIEAVLGAVGRVGGLNLCEVPAHLVGHEFSAVRLRMLKFRQGLVWGVFKDFEVQPRLDAVPVPGKLAPFRGIMLWPWEGLVLKREDRLVVLG